MGIWNKNSYKQKVEPEKLTNRRSRRRFVYKFVFAIKIKTVFFVLIYFFPPTQVLNLPLHPSSPPTHDGKQSSDFIGGNKTRPSTQKRKQKKTLFFRCVLIRAPWDRSSSSSVFFLLFLWLFRVIKLETVY